MRTQQIQSYEYNLGQLFSRIAKANATRCALVSLDKEEVSYENLEVLSNRIANWLVAKGTAKGDVIAIFHNKSRRLSHGDCSSKNWCDLCEPGSGKS